MSGQLWEVTGGEDKGGLLVRQSQALKSPQAEGGRLSTGALVRELELVGERLHYTRLTGTGPESGWVSTTVGGKELLVKTDRKPPEEGGDAKAPAAAESSGSRWYAAKPVVKGRKIRMAVLHGTSSNAKIQKIQLRLLEAACKDTVEFVYIEGTLKSTKENDKEVEMMEKYYPGQDFWKYAQAIDQRAEDNLLDYTGMPEAMDHLQAELKKVAPIDGIFGFSQGCNMLTVLAAQAVHGKGMPLAFVVHACGTAPGWKYRFSDLFEEPIRIPSLHYWGTDDWVTDKAGKKLLRRGEELTKLYKDPQTTTHNCDHRPLPKTKEDIAEMTAKIAAFIVEAAAADP